MKKLDKYFHEARKAFAEDLSDARESLEQAIAAFGPLMNAAINAGHHGKWINNRLPMEFQLIRTDDHYYAATISGRLGVSCDATIADSGISDRDIYVRWGRISEENE